MNNIFQHVKVPKIPGNVFDLSHDVKLSTRFGRLTPILAMETLPGDNFSIKGSAMIRLAPTVAPVMHQCNHFIHYFFVPNRVLWPNWDDFITGGRDGLNNSVHPFIQYDSNNATISSLYDYLGLPTENDLAAPATANVNALPFAAYQKIYDDYFRDQNQTAELDVTLTDGDNAAQIAMLTTLRHRAWEHDYFTSALPWTQKGPEALLPLGSTAPLEYYATGGSVRQTFRDDTSPFAAASPAVDDVVRITPGSNPGGDNGAGGYDTWFLDMTDNHRVDLSTATAASVIDVRRAFKLQEWLEKNAVGGSRYIESMKVHWGVSSSDKRLQRAEYIGGYKAPVKMSEVLQTSESATTPQGNMAGHGISIGASGKNNYKCEEHGWIIGVMSVLPKTGYQQGIHKMWSRTDKLDYPWPEFAHIGEQAIENKEIYLEPTDQTDTWGYTPRYSEMKFMSNRVSGYFRDTLDYWHMSRKFAAAPPLNESFIQMEPGEVIRVFASQTGEDELWCQVMNVIKAYRKLPIFGTPKL